MFHIVLYQPEIPPNTGNIMRLCANTGCRLHLIEPLGFFLDHKKLKRSAMDYGDISKIEKHINFDAFLKNISINNLYALSTKGNKIFNEPSFEKNDAFLFGPETRGLPKDILSSFDNNKLLTIPMLENSRSINLANSVSIMIYGAWSQHNFTSD